MLLTTPERRLSMHLKRLELWQQGAHELAASMDELAALPYVDLLDESDVLLSHRYQLVYACGSPVELPDGLARATAAQALLRTLSLNADQGATGAALAVPGVAVWRRDAALSSYRHVRLLPGDALDGVLPQLHTALAEALLGDPPYAMRWLKAFEHKVCPQAALLRTRMPRVVLATKPDPACTLVLRLCRSGYCLA